jgi:hypothetical protein
MGGESFPRHHEKDYTGTYGTLQAKSEKFLSSAGLALFYSKKSKRNLFLLLLIEWKQKT